MSNEPTIQDIYYKLGGLESKIDSVLTIQRAESEFYINRLTDLEEKHESQNDRIGHLELIEAKRTGMLVVIASVVSVVGSILVKFVTSNLHFG